MKLNSETMNPYIAAIIIFLVLAFAFCMPVFQGKSISQGDVMNARGMQQELAKYNKETGNYALWTNSMFGGMPAYQISNAGVPKYNIFFYVDRFIRSIFPQYSVDILLLYLLCGFVLFISMGFSPWISIIGAVVFCFSSYNVIIIKAGHVNKALAIATMPAVIGGVMQLYRNRYIPGFIITTLAFGLQMSYNHVQMTYYMFLMLGIFVIIMFIQAIMAKTLRPFIIATTLFGGATLLGILPNATNLLTTQEYSKETMRGGSALADESGKKRSGLDKDYALAWSYGKAETFTIFIPNFHGGASGTLLKDNSNVYKELINHNVPENQAQEMLSQEMPTYWGDQAFTAGPVYFGAIVCFLFILGFFLIRSPIKWWLLASAVFSIMLSWGRNFTPLTDLFFEYFPLYNKFRAVSSILIIANIAFCMFAIYVLNEIINKKYTKELLFKYIKYTAYITGGLCLFFIVMASGLFSFQSLSDDQMRSAGYPNWLVDALVSDRIRMFRMDAFRSLIFIGLFIGVIWAFMSDKLNLKYTLMVVGFLLLIDMWGVGKRYLNSYDFVPKRQKEFVPTEADLAIMKDTTLSYRVFDLTRSPFNDSRASYFHKSIGGYHGAKLSRYQDIIEQHLSKQNMKVINMLNTKYMVIDDKQNSPYPYKNPDALGNAWFVDTVMWAQDAAEAIRDLNYFTPATTAVIEKTHADYITNNSFSPIHDSTASITLNSYKPDQLSYTSRSQNAKLAVFSEIYYNDHKGWEATIDGKPAQHIRVNYILRGMVIPAGEHKIEFVFKPKTFYTGQKIALSSSIFIAMLFAGLLGFVFYKRKEE